MIQKLYNLLKILFGANIGLFIGHALYEVLWYRKHPEIYEMTSAPWYTNILIEGILAFLIAVILGGVLWLMKRKMSKETPS